MNDNFATGALPGLSNAIRALGLGANVRQQAQLQSGLMSAQAAKAGQDAEMSGLKLEKLRDPGTISTLNSIMPGLGDMYATGGDVNNLAGGAKTLQQVGFRKQVLDNFGNPGTDRDTINMLTSALEGKTYEPFKNIGETGSGYNAATGQGVVIDPGMRALFGEKEGTTPLMRNLVAAGLQPGTKPYQDAMLAGTKTGTTVNVGGEKAWDNESAKLFAKRYDDLATQAQAAQQMMGMYDLAEQALSSGVRTGVGGESELNLRRFAQSIGVGDADKVAGGELIRAIQNRMALIMRSPDSGMGMPGAVSDRDLVFLRDAQIGLDRTPEGNRKMLAAFRALEQRKVDISRLADDYIAEHGRLDFGFNRAVRDYAAANPLFNTPPEPQPAAGAPSGATGDDFAHLWGG
ncbi:hypothetical protein AVE30378_01014 [Achromobacter veterisilvae]|uniref:Uncharacterized protein n=1 Tax=Achromobacter veterisilvae TaxID=2069367 RepID=A0A446C8Q4_9BURK|nr:hypothetical protein [Achromobacter veterisilvae]SSW64312.1 hypothetical protein AVE30378_01014 [Achromobacter veterisilvae]